MQTDPEILGPTGTVRASLSKAPDAHKYGHGHALVLSGGPGRGGAGRLAARGALRIGAGLVTLGCPPEALAENAAQLTAIMLTPLPDAAALAERLSDPRITALCAGPGLGLDTRAERLVAEVLAARRATVLDADALSLLAARDSLMAHLHAACVLTPHEGEFARLFPDLAPVSGDTAARVAAVRAAAARAGCAVLLKGPVTAIADPSGQAAVSDATGPAAAPWLATAGAGDVLAGFIAGLLARGQPPFRAAATAAWLHAECARAFGPGLIAEDLPEALPGVFRALGV